MSWTCRSELRHHKAWGRSRPLPLRISTSRDAPSGCCFIRWSPRNSMASFPQHWSVGIRCRVWSRPRFATSSPAGWRSTDWFACIATSVAAIAWWRSRASAEAFAALAADAVWPRPPRILSTGCCRRCRCGSGCSPCRSRFAIASPTTTLLPRRLLRRFCAPCSPPCEGGLGSATGYGARSAAR